MIMMPILSYGYQLNDCLVGILGAICFMMSNIIMATAPMGWVMYVEAECKEKWHQLRSNFMREMRKIRDKPLGSPTAKTRRWVFYDAMEFLIPHVTPRGATSSNAPTPPEEDASSEVYDAPDNTSTSALQDAPDDASVQETKFFITDAIKKRPNDNGGETDPEFSGQLKKMREQAASRTLDIDPDRQFLLSLLPLMKQLSPRDSIDVRIEILEAFRRKLFKPAPHTPSSSHASDRTSEH
ncbi:uncharacterized protein LOC135197188 [Macrobrachium nipponense]|uniref:uncharacterized protein LOC135197188 n=1 Tax=Macrobrachium nipponense TaxID=159736 RepID=UPI0030C7E09B